MLNKIRLKKHIFYITLADLIISSISWFTAYWLRYGLNQYFTERPINPVNVYLNGLPLIILTWLFVLSYFGLYNRNKNITPFDELHSIVKAVSLGLLIIMSISFVFKEYDFGRLVVLFSVLLNFIFISLSRYFIRRFENRQHLQGREIRSVLIVGAGVTGIMAMQKLSDHPEIGYLVTGFLDDDKEKEGTLIGNAPVLGKIKQLPKIIKEYNIKEVIIAIPSYPHKKILELIVKLEGLGANVKVVTDLFDVLKGNVEFELIENLPIVGFRDNNDGDILYSIFRRVTEIIISILILILTFPVWIIISIAIKADSKGPVFFKHKRVGKDETLFDIYKFRTMYQETDPYNLAPQEKDDSRITRVGKFLRQTSLDEFPQLINVLKGNMSIIGPRPEMPFIVAKYEEWQKKRLEVTPGITGLWQILGRKDLPLHDNLEYDFYYIKNRGFLLDLTILLKTIPAIILKKGAY